MNRQEKLVECLTSVREQEYPDKQIIVVDNGSSDKTMNLIREHFPDVELLVLSSNQGVAGGRNRGVEVTRGEICIFLDDDAYFTNPQATYRAVSYFQKDPQLACIAFLIRNFSSFPDGVYFAVLFGNTFSAITDEWIVQYHFRSSES